MRPSKIDDSPAIDSIYGGKMSQPTTCTIARGWVRIDHCSRQIRRPDNRKSATAEENNVGAGCCAYLVIDPSYINA